MAANVGSPVAYAAHKPPSKEEQLVEIAALSGEKFKVCAAVSNV